MPVNRDPSKAPEVPIEVYRRARSLNAFVCVIVLDDPDDEQARVSFTAVTPCLPRIGEELFTEDSLACNVNYVAHLIRTIRDEERGEEFILLTPYIEAALTPAQTKDREAPSQ